MFEVPGSNVTGVYICEDVVTGKKKADYITGPIETNETTVDTEEYDGTEENAVSQAWEEARSLQL